MQSDKNNVRDLLNAKQLERRKLIYRDIALYILTLKDSKDIANEKEKREINKEIKKLVKIQEHFYKPEIKKIKK